MGGTRSLLPPHIHVSLKMYNLWRNLFCEITEIVVKSSSFYSPGLFKVEEKFTCPSYYRYVKEEVAMEINATTYDDAFIVL